MSEPDIKDAILTRRFDLRDGGRVDIHIWAPIEVAPNCQHDCAYRITGIGSGKLRAGRGVDDVQAMTLTLQMIGSQLYSSKEYQEGDLTWLGGRDLGLPILPGEKPGHGEYEKADVLTTGGQSAIVLIPGDRFAYFAWPGERLEGLVSRLENISEQIEINDVKACETLKETINGLAGELKYFEAVCKSAGVDLAYVRTERKD